MFIFFDIGSTLMDGPPQGPAKRLAALLGLPEEMRRPLDDFLLKTSLEGPRALADYLISRCNVDPDSAMEASDTLWKAQIRESRVIPGARESLQRLRSAGIPYGFISNIWPPFHQGFQRLFREEIRDRPCFLSFELGLRKPDTALYRAALSALSLSPEETLMVGDTYANDMAPVMAMGMKTIWVLRRPEKEHPDLVRVLDGQLPAPDRTLASMEQLGPDAFHALFTPR
uniref:Haloacid dehalogenase superfamily, subfamily IA, variant 3 with third motif having DD or ED/haloacid dehalogenase superfamily, subfamily IA, variant 1 with third motif having Dx(3-4)D or Dx(3-4)E n=1 Tax=Candidatus Kentrum sp. UNK TaxID=2126344 RepID=A0A451B457_9GAMM|nr:MAG: haloacid dehalogenase superfamily, subfamily IA, variant 3 with third motif having DD or ED/haloacid dehalogenase superfamily, subfamily IA, variant 1 with third motif having Dx(3-4)D or Dx(3-4)E [Candidatus Kentron sp. UNK]VFK73079.1 MAG: haloacid dehalogenase superfamily, subfamily IA, variant 3 with third motif having DD or ED/haloacid dehalogenase superfamily, subfamily IA, variant 1 with third motif having Dx(3-4)D or Dx(3-4)E [Candidatus Kentron sp. UNK]